MNNTTPLEQKAKKKFDIEKIRSEFPVLHQKVREKPLVYLDNAATAQKPQTVIDVSDHYYKVFNANIHRGVHFLSQIATDGYEAAREKVRDFINAEKTSEIIFTKGTTESINLVSCALGRTIINEGDEILITYMEHHSNIVPWQLLCEERKAKLKVAPINEKGELLMDEFENLISEKTKIISVVHQSNTLGTINPIKEIVAIAHKYDIPVMVDGAQSVPHFSVDVQDLDCDFYAFSGHKMYGPTGIGILYGKEKWLEKMKPYQGGGDMISSVTFEKTTYNELPYKFEAGTPNIVGGIGLGAAVDYLQTVGMDNVERHEIALLRHAEKVLVPIDELRVIGTARNKGGVFSFVMNDIHPHDIGTLLDIEGIAIRTGHLCTQPVIAFFNIPAVARAAFALYNTEEEIDMLAEGLKKVRKVFA